MIYSFRFLLLGLLIAGCVTLKEIGDNSLQGSALEPAGRYIKTGGSLHLVSSGAYAGFSFTGNSCTLYIAAPAQHSYFQYELDGAYQNRVMVPAGSAQPVVLEASRPGRHTIELYKTTEAHTGPLVIEKIEAENIKALPLPQKPFIEFIGNSITCGAAADTSGVPCGTGAYHDQHNAYMAYGPRIARALNTHFMLSSVSGIGIYRNWNSDGPTMPQVYEKTHLQQEGDAWNFTNMSPRIVSIALGTNDFSGGDGKKTRAPFDSARFVQQYVLFVQKVKEKYPKAQVALLSSPMVHGENNSLLQHLLQKVKVEIDARHPDVKPVALFFFTPMKARGCTGHPSVADHALMAETAIPFFRSLLNN